MTGTGTTPPSVVERREAGRELRRRLPRSALARLTTGSRDPLGILATQNAVRLPELVPVRIERMAQSPFAFYRGTAALMAADLAGDEHTGILVASCGDAHVANFGLYASPLRSLVFDLNDFDEAAWAPWEWDLKRLVTSVVVGGQAAGRAESVVREAARAAVRRYASALDRAMSSSLVDRYFAHFDPHATLASLDRSSRAALKAAIRDAERRTGARAARRLLETDDATGAVTFVERPPIMTHVAPDIERDVHRRFADYVASANVDVQLVLQQCTVVDVIRRVVGVGSVGTRCYLAALRDGAGHVLILQVKEAVESVLVQFGGITQPPTVAEHFAAHGEGGRVVALQRALQASSDPFLGHFRRDGRHFYVRQFHDMKGGIDIETLDDDAFGSYAVACATLLARAHGQSPTAGDIAGYAGGGRALAEALVEWAYAYAELSRHDYELFRATTTNGATT